ncbi:RecX family transcriptional regulator [Actinokineospora inagensis]|uniref:RecX family transcriptional regulator n=1 Tax=Actinokineospora inagensis TaxID=103730 RepID=UPI0003FB5C2A
MPDHTPAGWWTEPAPEPAPGAAEAAPGTWWAEPDAEAPAQAGEWWSTEENPPATPPEPDDWWATGPDKSTQDSPRQTADGREAADPSGGSAPTGGAGARRTASPRAGTTGVAARPDTISARASRSAAAREDLSTSAEEGAEAPEFAVLRRRLAASDEPGGGRAATRQTERPGLDLETSEPTGGERDRRGRAASRRAGRRGADPEARGADHQDSTGGEPDRAELAAKARDLCYRLLAGRDRTRLELAQALRRKEIPDDVAAGVLAKFDAAGLINDVAFAESWVRSRHEHRGLGRRALATELRRKGVDEDVVAEAVAAVDTDAEVERAAELVRKKLPGLRAHDDQVKIRRLVAMLARRGYSEGLAYRVVRTEIDADRADQAD